MTSKLDNMSHTITSSRSITELAYVLKSLTNMFIFTSSIKRLDSLVLKLMSLNINHIKYLSSRLEI